MNVTIIEDIESEPVTLAMAKEWMNIDFADYDDLIESLIISSRETTEANSGTSLGVRTYQVSGNQKDHKVYPITPFIEDVVWEDEDGVKTYRYKAGYEFNIPQLLINAIRKRVATGFAYRQNGLQESVYMAVNQSNSDEYKFRQDLYI